MKKKIIFLARELDSSKIIADLLIRENLIDAVIFETGKSAKQKKLKRMFRRRPLWRLLLLPFDILFLIMMTVKANRLFYKKYPSIPQPKASLIVDDVNEASSIQFLQGQKPDILLIYGTSILKKPILSIPQLCVLNIHGAIVPKYRNVHGEFWVVAHKKYSELGTSILVADEGIDSGDVVRQRVLGISSPITVSEAKLAVFDETLKLALQVVKEARDGLIPRQRQADSTGPLFQTPGILDWIKYKVSL